jgi:LPS-assembly lipoprotein
MNLSQTRLYLRTGTLRAWLGLLCCAALLQLSACGFQLRGAFQSTDELGKIYIDGGFKNDPVGKSLRHDITAAGGELTDFKGDADYVVWIGNLETEVRAASYDVLVRAVENEIIMRVVFEVRSDEGQRIYGPELIYAERVFEYDVQGVTSSAAQLSIIERELKENMGRQIAQRLAALEPAELDTDQDIADEDTGTTDQPAPTQTNTDANNPVN